jgi:hypothetical protein
VILGHAHITTTNQIYTHADEASERETLSKLNKLLGGTTRDPVVVNCCGRHGTFPQVELRGFEPLTPCMQGRCATTAP